jgi:ribosome-binding protein aMBF1 (putative translation factor)
MRTTTDALKILGKRMAKSPRRQRMVEAEQVNLQAAHAIREARHKAGLSQAELARKIGTRQSAIARLESAEYTGHTLKLLERIALACKRHVRLAFEPVGTR